MQVQYIPIQLLFCFPNTTYAKFFFKLKLICTYVGVYTVLYRLPYSQKMYLILSSDFIVDYNTMNLFTRSILLILKQEINKHQNKEKSVRSNTFVLIIIKRSDLVRSLMPISIEVAQLYMTRCIISGPIIMFWCRFH